VRKGVGPEDIELGMREVFGADAHKLHVHAEDADEEEGGVGETQREFAPLIVARTNHLHACSYMLMQRPIHERAAQQLPCWRPPR